MRRWRRRDLVMWASSLGTVAAVTGCTNKAQQPAEAPATPHYHFPAADYKPWSQPAVHGLTATTGHDNPEASVSILTLTGTHGRIRSRSNTRFYYVLNGPVTFEVAGHRFDAEKNDTIVIPRATPYNLWSPHATLLLFHVPAFDPTGDSPA